jgi:hypothetical protein
MGTSGDVGAVGRRAALSIEADPVGAGDQVGRLAEEQAELRRATLVARGAPPGKCLRPSLRRSLRSCISRMPRSVAMTKRARR